MTMKDFSLSSISKAFFGVSYVDTLSSKAIEYISELTGFSAKKFGYLSYAPLFMANSFIPFLS